MVARVFGTIFLKISPGPVGLNYFSRKDYILNRISTKRLGQETHIKQILWGAKRLGRDYLWLRGSLGEHCAKLQVGFESEYFSFDGKHIEEDFDRR